LMYELPKVAKEHKPYAAMHDSYTVSSNKILPSLYGN